SDLRQSLFKLFARRSAGCAERVVLVESVAVEKMNLFHRRLRNEVENVGTCSAKANDSDSQRLELAIDCHDVCPAAGRVLVKEHGVLGIRLPWLESLRLHSRIDCL